MTERDYTQTLIGIRQVIAVCELLLHLDTDNFTEAEKAELLRMIDP